jgi:hypothetical protein
MQKHAAWPKAIINIARGNAPRYVDSSNLSGWAQAIQLRLLTGLTAEFPEVWIEPEPCVASTGEESQSLCRDLSLQHVILFDFSGSPAPY